ncbi:MAG: chorismate synthase [Lachnospiraceae bacterium]
MAGSIFGKLFTVTTWGESHGQALGVIVDGVPAGLPLSEEDIQKMMDRRKPGQSRFASSRKEDDQIRILSGVFEGLTTGTPVSMMVMNSDHQSLDYEELAKVYRPGHADYTYDCKYGIRDYRGGGRASGRETIGRTAAGSIAKKILAVLGVEVQAYTRSIGPVEINYGRIQMDQADKNPLYMPDPEAAAEAEEYLEELKRKGDSAGGVIECVIRNLPAGIGDPVFDKLDASLAKAIMSIGAVKGFEIGDGFQAAAETGSANNDAFYMGRDGKVCKSSNHSGGILGGISDGSRIVFRAAVKPTPSIGIRQNTVTANNENTDIQIRGRHDPVIVPRAVVVVEAMAAITVVDLLFCNMPARMDRLCDYYNNIK